MQQPTLVDNLSGPAPASDESAALAVSDYLQEALDTLVVPAARVTSDLSAPYHSPSSWPYADSSLHSAAAPPPGRTSMHTEADGSHPTDLSKAKLNREYQRRFRMRSKVCCCVPAFSNVHVHNVIQLLEPELGTCISGKVEGYPDRACHH